MNTKVLWIFELKEWTETKSFIFLWNFRTFYRMKSQRICQSFICRIWKKSAWNFVHLWKIHFLSCHPDSWQMAFLSSWGNPLISPPLYFLIIKEFFFINTPLERRWSNFLLKLDSAFTNFSPKSLFLLVSYRTGWM